ncbi:MAG: hypothetical protein ABIH72_00720 [archaeon]
MKNLNPYFRVKKSQKGTYDIELQNINELRKFSSIESHILVYPLSRNINADHILCNPFEEYVQDIKEGEDSVYSKISLSFNKVLGLVMGIIILLFFWMFAPEAFLSIDSVVAIFAAYIIGKELGQDLEMFLVNISSNWRLQFYKNYFNYKLERATTLTNYTRYAKRYRYGMESILPISMGFDKRSNSQIVRLKFKRKDLGDRNNIHILSIKVLDKVVNEFEKEGYIIGFKLCLNNRKIFFTKSIEIFQAINKNIIGCLDGADKVLKDFIFFRKVIKISRIKFNSRTGIRKDRIISF